MLGAIAGDIIGSVYEFLPTESTDFPLFASDSRFTDDTVLTVAVADCLLNRAGYIDKFHEYTLAYPHRAYGLGFYNWVHSGSREPYNSWGNGSAMRVSPVAYAFETLEQALHEAKASAEVTHNHPGRNSWRDCGHDGHLHGPARRIERCNPSGDARASGL